METQTKVEQIEKEADAFKTLIKRRPMLALFIGLSVVCPTIFGVYQFYQNHVTAKANIELKAELMEVKHDRDSKATQLAPFLAAAKMRFPDAPPEQRLELLLKRMEEAVSNVQDAARRITKERVLPDNVAKRVVSKLRGAPSLRVEIRSLVGDAEGTLLAEQLKALFSQAGWPIDQMLQTINTEIPRGVQFYFAESPSVSLQEPFLDILDVLRQERRLFVDPTLAKGTLLVRVGAQ